MAKTCYHFGRNLQSFLWLPILREVGNGLLNVIKIFLFLSTECKQTCNHAAAVSLVQLFTGNGHVLNNHWWKYGIVSRHKGKKVQMEMLLWLDNSMENFKFGDFVTLACSSKFDSVSITKNILT